MDSKLVIDTVLCVVACVGLVIKLIELSRNEKS